MRTETHRPPVLILHRARTEEGEKKSMESYRAKIIAMLDTIQDARMMRIVHDVLKALLSNR